MSNKPNHRRGEERRTENGPRYENPDPGAGCNTTHVARSRRKWKTRQRRAERRTGRTSPKFHMAGQGRPLSFEKEVLEP